jgi:hypothetical protein
VAVLQELLHAGRQIIHYLKEVLLAEDEALNVGFRALFHRFNKYLFGPHRVRVSQVPQQASFEAEIA